MIKVKPLPGASFGGLIESGDAVKALEPGAPDLPDALYTAEGLLVCKGLECIEDDPELLVRLSRMLGPEVENYHRTLTPENMVHTQVAEILVLSNLPPCSRPPPARPDPSLTASGDLPMQFPHRRGWHTDQSFRRPPPDISLFYAVVPARKGEAQTLYANGIGAYEALPADLKEQVEGLDGLHALLGTGRAEKAVKAGEAVQPLLPHQQSQRQPVVRVHPVTGRKALYLCEAGQMDWVDGPFPGLEPGPYGDGAKLLYALMSHYTRPEFTYAHEWDKGDLVIYDNRSLVHAATWYDADSQERLMWRTTVSGNPGEAYAGESPSWRPTDDAKPMEGLGDYKWR